MAPAGFLVRLALAVRPRLARAIERERVNVPALPVPELPLRQLPVPEQMGFAGARVLVAVPEPVVLVLGHSVEAEERLARREGQSRHRSP